MRVWRRCVHPPRGRTRAARVECHGGDIGGVASPRPPTRGRRPRRPHRRRPRQSLRCLPPWYAASIWRRTRISLLQLVLIDGEVHDSNAPSLARIFRRLAGDLAASIKDAFSALVMSGTKLDTNAFLQATMEVKALQLILQKFESADVIAEFESVLSVIAQARKTQSYANMQAIEGPLDRFKTEMRFQLECLR
eukprot:Opistho-2@41523